MATGSRRGSRKRATLGVGSRGPGMSRMCSQVLAEVHRSILGLLRQITSSARVSTLLDVGCWDGGTTIEYARAAGGARAYGIEVFQDPASQAAGRGISVAVMDLERDRFPWADQSIDLSRTSGCPCPRLPASSAPGGISYSRFRTLPVSTTVPCWLLDGSPPRSGRSARMCAVSRSVKSARS
ncbi:MAG: hypothetical protein E6G98_06820 [Bacillati bacterium ANGP1]|uniref:Class I SAM-dependent methyltransferase n=1 Tax=Candidatus Segetimicrobium genomatis TaxID=2569760 RepID=A0A537LRV1_9BACT|nr:MAG: hypothetical protein E6G98_06820 [Terrabacteria group bacterium ANGP1]